MTTSATVPPIDSVAPGLRSRVAPCTFAGTQRALLGTGVVALAVSLIGGLAGSEPAWQQFLHSYLVSYMFGLSIVLGAMFFVLVQHLARSGWSVVVRRIAENLMGAMPLMAVLFLPIAFGHETLYHHWVHPDPGDEIVRGKSGYLNTGFFFVRAALYFAIWIGIATWFRRTSMAQDRTGDAALTLRMARVAAPCMFLFALSLTFAAIDWLKSLDPHWYSTMWGVYYFAGSYLSFMAVLGLIMLWLQRQGWLTEAITVEHYHDVGKLLFSFVVFWTYVAFSQYMLIWYANLPEETMWFKHHLEGEWKVIGDALIVGHFMFPFVFLMSRHVKRTLPAFAFAAVFLLVMHWIDMHWIVMPQLHEHGMHLAWQDLATLIAVLALLLGVFVRATRRAPLVPERDPRLRESLAFVNH